MYKNINEVTLSSLKENTTKIHFFGLGFIQIKLGDTYRIHFYNKSLPAITAEEDVHNHRYDFTSTVFSGEFSQEIFAVDSGDTYVLEMESCKEGVSANSEPKICGIKKMMTQTFTQGSSYHISHEVFHRVKSDNAITFLKRGEIKKDFAEVIHERTAPKVCPFSKKISEEELWNIVGKMLEDAKGSAQLAK
jgi:hypothetical protein